MKFNDAVFGLLLILLGGAVLLHIQAFPAIPGQQVGPALYPGLIAVGLCLGGAILVVQGWRARTGHPWFAAEDWVKSPRHLLAFAVLVAGVVFYMLAAQSLGFVITSTLVLTALLGVLRVKPGRSLLIALMATLVIHFAFYKLLRVPLPWGLLTNFAW